MHGFVAFVTIFSILLLFADTLQTFDYGMEARVLTLRWVEYAITCTLMTASSVLSSGTNDFNFLITILASGVALQMIGCAIEQCKNQWKLLLIIGAAVKLVSVGV